MIEAQATAEIAVVTMMVVQIGPTVTSPPTARPRSASDNSIRPAGCSGTSLLSASVRWIRYSSSFQALIISLGTIYFLLYRLKMGYQLDLIQNRLDQVEIKVRAPRLLSALMLR